MQALLGSLTESELALVRETERQHLAGLDEDALVGLHTRVRRARDKYTELYRRASAGRVGASAARVPSPLPQPQRPDRRPRTPDRTKRHATTRAATSRRQARRDSR